MYISGVVGKKLEREFTALDRKKIKYKYYRRKRLFDLVLSLTRSCLTHLVAIDQIYQVYER